MTTLASAPSSLVSNAQVDLSGDGDSQAVSHRTQPEMN